MSAQCGRHELGELMAMPVRASHFSSVCLHCVCVLVWVLRWPLRVLVSLCARLAAWFRSGAAHVSPTRRLHTVDVPLAAADLPML